MSLPFGPSSRNTVQSKKKQTSEIFRQKENRGVLTFLGAFLLTLFLVYMGSKPQTYHLSISEASPFDIEAPRSIVNSAETLRRATEAMAQVPNKMTQSEELTALSLSSTRSFLELARKSRQSLLDKSRTEDDQSTAISVGNITVEALAQEAELLQKSWRENLGLEFDLDQTQDILSFSETRFQVFFNNLNSATSIIAQRPISESSLASSIQQEMARLYGNDEYYQEDQVLAVGCLKKLLKPNLIFNKEATDNARKDAFDRVQQNPIMINRGTRIVSEGDIITEETYAILSQLNLLDNQKVNLTALAGQALLVGLLAMVLFGYLRHFQNTRLHSMKDNWALIVALLIPLAISAYIGRSYQLSPPVYYAAVVISAYFGFQTAAVCSFCLCVAVMPIVNFNPQFLMIGLTGCLVAALFTQSVTNQDHFAKLILAIAGSNFLMTSAYSLIQNTSLTGVGLEITSSVISGIVAVVGAIGSMPLFELIFNTVSPSRLIELSQPGQPLLRRLFLEAPGTSQHSMMVANLADAAAEAIGANSLICRVGAYYHDIGKLVNPILFSENQTVYNPHDSLPPQESAEIIMRHPIDGLQIGRKNRLPKPILNIIEEHHGSTVLQYFYQKACDLAERGALPPPDINQFRYPTPIPSSRESAIVMLADSTEAAVKSAKAENLDEAEEMMRKIFKIKNDQNQLLDSGLSYAEVDRILQAFKQVYAGHFHERVQYQNDRTEARPIQ